MEEKEMKCFCEKNKKILTYKEYYMCHDCGAKGDIIAGNCMTLNFVGMRGDFEKKMKIYI